MGVSLDESSMKNPASRILPNVRSFAVLNMNACLSSPEHECSCAGYSAVTTNLYVE